MYDDIMMLNKGDVLEVACLQLGEHWNSFQVYSRLPNRRKCSSNNILLLKLLPMRKYSI